jgi:putative peptidoglycan lipid II flippase
MQDEGQAPLRGVWRATAVMGAGTALSRVTGLAKVAAMTYALGVTGSRLADTYSLANTTPNILYELVLGGIFTSVLVPVLIETRTNRSGDESSLVTLCMLALVAATAAAMLAAPALMQLYTFRVHDPSVRLAQQRLGTDLLRWFAPQILFLGISALAGAQLVTRRRFGPPMFAPVLNNLVVSAVFVLFARVHHGAGMNLSRGQVALLGAGTTAGLLAQAAVLVPLLRGAGWRLTVSLRDPAVGRLARLAGWVAAYVALNQVGLWATYALADRVRGGVASYQIAFTFFLLPHSLFAVGIVTALLPDLATSAARNEWAAYRSHVRSGVRGVAYLLAPAAVGYLVLAGPITRLLLAHGVAGTGDAAAVAGVLRTFVLGLVFFSAFQLLTRCFNQLPDTRTPAVVNAVVVTVWIGANIPLFALMGTAGLALAYAVSYVVGSACLLWLLRRRVGGLGLGGSFGTLLRIGAASAAMGMVVWGLARAIPADAARVLVCALAGAAAYAAFSRLLRIPEYDLLASSLRRGVKAAAP